MEKPVISKHVFHVYKKEFVTPHYIRITLQGEGAKDFAKCDLGANNKIFVPPAGKNEVKFASFDTESGEWIMPSEDERPIVRTYTHRAIEVENNLITIDFVNHGDNGPASSWALHAKEGDPLGVAMKIRPSVLYQPADWYLLVGDATAIPVISVILESFSKEVKGHCILEVQSQEDIQKNLSHEGFSIEWVINEHPESGSSLSEKVRSVEIPDKVSHFAYVACEYSSVKEIRQFFKEDFQWTNKDFYAFSYWKAGVAEDKSAQERHDEKHQD